MLGQIKVSSSVPLQLVQLLKAAALIVLKILLWFVSAADQADPATSSAAKLGLQQPLCTAGAAAGT